MRMTLPSAIIMAAAIWHTQILMSGSPLPDKQDRNLGYVFAIVCAKDKVCYAGAFCG